MGRKILPSLAVLFLSLFFGLCGYVLSSNRPDEGYDSIAVEYSRLHGLNPNLTRAVIEAESSGQAGAVSSAGALGIMQLMPATAREMAERLHLPCPADADLMDPRLNILLGTYYLRLLKDSFSSDPYLYLAAYNAGPGSVRRWMKKAPLLPSEQVVSRRAHPQTRAYVRKVIRRWTELEKK